MANKVDRVIGQKKAIVSPAAGKEPPQFEPASKLSHDIRTQLYIINGFAELMLLEIPGKLNEAQRRNLQDVLKSGRRLQALLQDIIVPPGGR